MFVVNYSPTTAPNPTCCSDPDVICANCAAEALVHNDSRTPKPTPLGQPNWDFDDEQPNSSQSSPRPIVVNSRGPRPAGGILGQPVWEF